MTDLTQYEKGCSPCAIQRKYGLTYAQGYELAERLRKTQELELENKKLKELLKECQHILNEQNFYRNTPVETDTIYRTRCLRKQELLTKIDEALK
jgi:hypothetical protein